MKLAFVIPRYGPEIIGGAETLGRQVAERLATLHPVEVLTTCAGQDYRRWANAYPPGERWENGILVRRFPVEKIRDYRRFDCYTTELVHGWVKGEQAQIEWVRQQGPYAPALVHFIQANARAYDFFVFVPYLYYTTFFGLRAVPERAILIPAAHDEPYLKFEIYRSLMRLPRGIVYLSPEERDLVHLRSDNDWLPHRIIGMGLESPGEPDPGAFRQRYNLPGPFVLYVGRVTQAKGCDRLLENFIAFRQQQPDRDLKLVLVGTQVMEIPTHPDILYLGRLSERDKFDALAAAEVFVMPSEYESYSIVVLEAMLAGTPVLVNGDCEVLRQHCLRSQAGLYYVGRDDFAAGLELLLDDPALRQRMGANGHAYVQANYTWPAVERQYQHFLKQLKTDTLVKKANQT
ncbi:MAG TPA: glycosyltransferase [Anaerolineae bacterium]|nr:glycosyltransferase [Anaerolineae bacterium]